MVHKNKLEEYAGNVYHANKQMVSNCYNTGALSGGGRVGSIVGQCVGASFDRCWWTSAQGGSRKFRFLYKFFLCRGRCIKRLCR